MTVQQNAVAISVLQQNAVAISVLQQNIAELQELVSQLIQRQPTQEQINKANLTAKQNIVSCLGTFCGITASGVDYKKAPKCIRDCPVITTCIPATQIHMMAKLYGISGRGENWKTGFPDGLGPNDC